jgi:Mg2+-importing ATPase
MAEEEARRSQQSLPFWSLAAAEMLQRLQTTKEGLTSEEAGQRLARHGSHLLKPRKRSDPLALLLAQFKSPIILIAAEITKAAFCRKVNV